MKLYAVTAKCGHVGRNYYALKTFAVKADNGREAAKVVRDYPRVKHHHKDAIREVHEVDAERFEEIIENNNQDPYFHCACVQEQRAYNDPDIYPEERYTTYRSSRCANSKPVYEGKICIKNPKKYIKHYYFEERWDYEYDVYEIR